MQDPLNGTHKSTSPIRLSRDLPVQNIREFLHHRDMSAAYLAELAHMPLSDVRRILDPAYDPNLSEVIRIHQAINRVCDCRLSELLNPERPISPSSSDISRLRMIHQTCEHMLEHSLPGYGFNRDYQYFETHELTDSFTRFCKLLEEQVNETLNLAKLRPPKPLPAFVLQPAGSFRLNNIDSLLFTLGKNDLKNLKGKVHEYEEFMNYHSRVSRQGAVNNGAGHKNSAGNGKRGKAQRAPICRISPDEYKAAKYMFNPCSDLKLSEIRRVFSRFFVSTEVGADYTELIHSPLPEEGLAPEDSSTRFHTRLLNLSQICLALFEQPRNSEVLDKHLSVIDHFMRAIEPEWKTLGTGNDYLRRSGRTSDSIRMEPINLDDYSL